MIERGVAGSVRTVIEQYSKLVGCRSDGLQNLSDLGSGFRVVDPDELDITELHGTVAQDLNTKVAQALAYVFKIHVTFVIPNDEVGRCLEVCQRRQFAFGDVAEIHQITGDEHVIRRQCVGPRDDAGEEPTAPRTHVHVADLRDVGRAGKQWRIDVHGGHRNSLGVADTRNTGQARESEQRQSGRLPRQLDLIRSGWLAHSLARPSSS